METGGGMALRTRVTLLAVAGLLVIAAIAVLVWAAYADLRRTGDDVTQRLSPAADLSVELVATYERVDRESRTYVITGDSTARAGYLTARSLGAADVARLRPLLEPDTELLAELDAVVTAVDAWIPPVVEPAVQARDEGPLTDAETVSFLAESTSAYQAVSAATSGLQLAVSDARDASFDQLTAVARRLALALVGSAVLAFVLVVAAYLMVRRWVLTPLDDLGEQLRAVARDGRRDRVIDPLGPPELRVVGRDAESMRRALVAETDAARAAAQSLAEQGPVVAAVRDELATVRDPVAPGLVVHGELQPAEGVLAGDWWGVVALDGDRTAVVVIDVSGHGPLAGLVTMRLRTVLSVSLRAGRGPAVALQRAASALDGVEDGRFATAVVLVLDPAAGSVEWANAGHPAGWLLREGDPGSRSTLDPTGPLLSALGGSWTSRTSTLGPDDLVLLWSDGLTETRSASRELDEAGFADVLATLPSREPAELVPALLARLRARAPEWHRDDITLVAVRRRS